MRKKSRATGLNRRRFLQAAAATGAVASGVIYMPAIHAQARTVKLGYVSPKTGPLAAFAEVDEFIIGKFLETVKAGLQIGDKNYTIEVIVKDSQSNPNRAAEVAKELIVDDEIDLMLAGHTPETTNPVSTLCEIEEIPCVTSLAPWQPYFIGRQGNPGDPNSWSGFNYTYHFFWGLEDVIAVFTNMWNQLDTNKSVGGLFPNYEIRFPGGDGLETATLPYRVELPPRHELEDVGMAANELRGMVATAGGSFYREEDLHRLGESVKTEQARYSFRREIILWNWYGWLVFVLLITAEWVARKFTNLS
jgi:hypothetical protein